MASGDKAKTSPELSELSESPSPQSKKDQGRKAKAGSSKKMTEKEQSERFIETARELETDEHGTAFEATLDRMFTRKANDSD